MDVEPHKPEHIIASSAGIMFLIVISLLGNSIVCLAVYHTRTLQTHINYFIVSLAISDIIVASISMPLWMTFEITKFQGLPQGISVEYLIKGWTFIDIIAGVASISNLVAISYERYLSIRSPLSHRRCMTNRSIFWAAMIVWAYAIVIGSTYLLLWTWKGRIVFVAIMGFTLPLFFIIFAYLRVFCVVRKVPKEIISRRENRRVSQTVCLIIMAFLICWTPFFIVSLLGQYCQSCGVYIQKHQWIRSLVKWLHYLNSCCNPFIYCIFNAHYKEAFKFLIRKLCLKGSLPEEKSQGQMSQTTKIWLGPTSTSSVPFLERKRKESCKDDYKCYQVSLPLEKSFCARKDSEPRYFPYNPQNFTKKQIMNDSSQIKTTNL